MSLSQSQSIAAVPISSMLGCELNKNLSIQAEAFNLLNRKDANVTYYYATRLPGEDTAGVNDFASHPIEPISFRLSLTANF